MTTTTTAAAPAALELLQGLTAGHLPAWAVEQMGKMADKAKAAGLSEDRAVMLAKAVTSRVALDSLASYLSEDEAAEMRGALTRWAAA